MASGNTLCVWEARSASLPATSYAQHDVVVGASSPAEAVPVLAFDSASTEYADFYGVIPGHYAGGGLTLTIVIGAATTSGGVTFEAAIRRLQEDAEDLDSTVFSYDFNSLDIATLPSASGEFNFEDITFTSGADMDSLAAGEPFILRVRRKHDDTNDTAAADAWLLMLHLKET